MQVVDELVLQCEVSAECGKVLQSNFKPKMFVQDIKDLQVLKCKIDICCLGLPCTDTALAGNRQGRMGSVCNLRF